MDYGSKGGAGPCGLAAGDREALLIGPEQGDPVYAWRIWREGRDQLFRFHPQSPLPEPVRGSFRGLTYFDYNPALRFAVEVQPAAPQTYDVSSSDLQSHAFTRFATATLRGEGEPVSIELYWMETYSGGLFLPFRDAGAGRSTYAGGRYVLDTAKGADLGVEKDRLVVDFNFAYQPSCAYDSRWICPLAPEPNRIPVQIPAGERL